MARKSRLLAVTDWRQAAKDGHYDVSRMALKLGISKRWLEMFMVREFGNSPLKLFTLWMSEEVKKAMRSGMIGKEVLAKSGYSDLSSLTRALMNSTGHGLRRKQKRRISASPHLGPLASHW